MKKIFFLVMLSVLSLSAMAQYAEDTENGIVSLAGKEGFTLKSKKGDFVFKPYLLVQASANVNWYDDEDSTKRIIRIMLLIRVLPYLMPYWDLREKHLGN